MPLCKGRYLRKAAIEAYRSIELFGHGAAILCNCELTHDYRTLKTHLARP